ncbi:MAG: hypothetical protein MK180_06740 [Rhodobacteraceae bacterium]|nr:hypothetical protein [Paracoccaceae bacterium]
MILQFFDDFGGILEVAGIWFTGIATFTAAYVALRVANRANRQTISVWARPMIEVTRGVSGSKVDVFVLSATNLGLRPVTIRSLAIRSRLPRYDAILMEGMAGSSPLPITLQDGETATWRFQEITPESTNWYRDLAEHFAELGSPWKWLAARNVRFFVVTSLGNEFFAPKERGLRKKILEQLAAIGETK